MRSSWAEQMVDLGVKEEDWKHFLSVATQHTYQKGEYVLQEGQSTAKLFQARLKVLILEREDIIERHCLFVCALKT